MVLKYVMSDARAGKGIKKYKSVVVIRFLWEMLSMEMKMRGGMMENDAMLTKNANVDLYDEQGQG